MINSWTPWQKSAGATRNPITRFPNADRRHTLRCLSSDFGGDSFHSATSRRFALVASTAAASFLCAAVRAPTVSARQNGLALQPMIIPLQWGFGGFLLHFILKGNDAKPATTFTAVADTGSPFLLVAKCLRKDCPSYCAQVGCFSGEGKPSDLPSSIEGYASGLVEITWRKDGAISFPDAIQSTITLGGSALLENLDFGVQGRIIGFGGTGKAVFLGLIRGHMSDIHTSFLEQTPYRSLDIDLRNPGQEVLTLSPFSLLGSSSKYSSLRLIDPRQWGDPVKHYAAVAKEVRVGGKALQFGESGPRKVLCLFDTGTTGAAITPSLHEAYLNVASQLAQTGVSWSAARELEVVFIFSDGKEVALKMQSGRHPTYGLGLDLVTVINELAWAGVGPAESIANYCIPGGLKTNGDRPFQDVMLLGLGFLVGRHLVIDVDNDEMLIES